LLGRDAAPAFGRVKVVKQRRELLQNRVHMALDGAQGVIRRHGGVEIDDGQKIRLRLWFFTHTG